MRSFRLASSAVLTLLHFATARSAESEDRPVVRASTPAAISAIGIVESSAATYVRTAVVSPIPGDAIASGTALRNAH